MKKLFSIAVALLLLCTAAAFAETEIRVPGHGVVYASADTATITLGVSAKKADVQEAQATVNTALAAIRQGLEAQGVPGEEITTDIVNVYTLWEGSAGGEETVYYQAYSTLAICTEELDRVGSLIDCAIEAGANSLDGVSFGLKDATQQKEAALRAALANARRQAEIIADESGLVITGIEAITQQSSYSYNTGVANYSKGAILDESAATVVQPARISIEATVEVVYNADGK